MMTLFIRQRREKDILSREKGKGNELEPKWCVEG